MPLPAGSASNSLRTASSPPAEAPIPTTGKSRPRGAAALARDKGRFGRGRAVLPFRLCPVVVADFLAVAAAPFKSLASRSRGVA